jgi:hypothetical protein
VMKVAAKPKTCVERKIKNRESKRKIEKKI